MQSILNEVENQQLARDPSLTMITEEKSFVYSDITND